MRVVMLGCALLALAACGTVGESFRVRLTPETRAIINARPEFQDRTCPEGTRTTVVGAEVLAGDLVVQITCVAL